MAKAKSSARARSVAVLGAIALCLAGVLATTAHAVEPVKHVSIYVEPFYRAGKTLAEAPQVNTGAPHAPLLASLDPKDILAARDLVQSHPQLVTPTTMMVLAIRLYDIGKRDDAAFWFYAAMDRYFTLVEVAQPGAPILAISTEAMRAFAALVGPYVNGYAFCDIAKQREIRTKALAWVEANTYEAIYSDKVPARGEDRKALLAKALADAREGYKQEGEYLSKPENVAKLRDDRKKNEIDERFCWK